MYIALLAVTSGAGLFGQTAPTVGIASATPASGMGPTTFTVSASDTGGAASIASIQMLVDWETNGSNACYVMYIPSAGLYLAMDQAGWLGPSAPGTGAPLINGQCILDVAATTVSSVGNTLTVNPKVTFNNTFVGTMGVYEYASDPAGNNTGWQQVLTYTTTAASSQLPTGSVTPSSGAGMSRAFTISSQDVNGWKYIGYEQLLIGPTNTTAVNSCLVMLNSGYSGALYLMNDAYTLWLGPIFLSAPATLSNHQCTIDSGATTMTTSGSNLTFNLSVSFAASGGFSMGQSQNVYLDIVDHAGHDTGFAAAGTWTVVAPTTTFDGWRVGAKSTGTYWGAAGEQIDLLSGNLNYSIPLIQAQGRAGLAATFALSYNSQIWKQTPNGSWLLGRDVGYGLGWTLQLGSLTPAGTYYILTDGTGAQYQLNGAAGNLWISQDGSYATYDATAQKLYFPDGGFWRMDVVSALGEPDAGTRYPSLIEDSNGNTIAIQYAQGAGGAGINTSGRITQITDSRVTGSSASYTFTYNTDSIPHLTAITNSISSTEKYTLAYYANQALTSPFGGTFGTATRLQTVAFTDLNTSTSLQYVTGTAELNQATTPAAGVLAWGYVNYTYPGGESYREVQSRQITSGTTLSPWTNSWTITRGVSSTLNLHPSATVADTGAGTRKVWNFQTASGPFFGLATAYEEQTGAGTALLHKDYTWSQDGAGNVYTGAVATTLDPGQSYQATSTTQQTLDIYGNTIQTKLHDYGNPTTPARTYNYTYLSSSNYLNAYIRNRLAQATVNGVTLETDSYDASSPALTDRPGITAHYSAYNTGNILRGNRTTTTQPGSTRNVSYDIGGMPVSADDGQGHSVTINPTSGTTFAAPGAILPNGLSTYQSTYTYTPALQPANATDPNNKTTTNAYDSYGRLYTSTTVTGMQTTYVYDYSQHTVSASAHSTGWIVGTPDHWQRTTTDGFGRTIRTEAGASSTSILSVVDTQYGPCACSPLGKMSAVSQPYAPGATPVWTQYTYDASGRTLTVTAPDGVSVTSYAYHGNQTTITDPAGHWKTYTYDASGNLLQVTEPGSLATLYTYDALNHLTQVSMTRGGTTQTRTFAYDSTTQRLTQATTPEAGTVQYAYNNDGTLQSKTDAMGQQTQYTYDALARVTQVGYKPNGQNEDTCQHVTYEYDQFHGQGSNPIGRLTGMYWSGGPGCIYGFGEEYTYDAQGRVWERAFTMTNSGVTPITLTSYFQYDAEGRLTVSTYPISATLNDATTYTTDYDALGRPSDLYMRPPQQPITLVNSATYNAAGQLTAMSTSAYTETRQYNANLQLTRLTAGGGQGIDFTYTYPTSGNNGRISQMTDPITPEQVNYTYDQLNRLVQAGTMTFAYDGFGNLTQQGQTYLSMDPNTNHINSAGYYYNANGNVIQTPNPTTSYAYDVANRLVSNGAIYNPRNQRVFDGTYIYLYTPEGKVVGKYQPVWSQYGSNAFIQGSQPNVYFGGKLIQEQGHWVMTDRLGSVRLKDTGERSSYQPYGAEVTTTADQRTKFATYYRDSAGMDYAGQRYYSNVTGRFLTPDPGGTETANPKNPGSWNQYAYVNADPVNHNDPSGTTMAGLQFCTGAVFPWDEEDCGDDTSGFVEAGAGGNWGGFNPCNRSQWLPNPLCPVQLVLLAPPSSPPPNATYLLVIGDCDYTGFGGHDVRRREYEVLDQHFQAMGNGLKVSESITKVTPTGHTIRGGGNWNTGEDGVSGAFYDFYSNGRNSTPTNALQEYFSGSTRLQVLEPDNLTNNPSTYSRYGTQGVYYTYSGVRIDSYYSNPIIGSKTPCDPPTPFF